MRVFLLIPLLFAACAEAPAPPPGITQRISGTAEPTPSQRDAVLARTDAYWRAIAESRHADAYAMFTTASRLSNPLDQFRKSARLPVGTLLTEAIHWLQNKARIHGPELYAVVSWRTDQGATGQLIWRADASAGWLLERDERL